MNVGLRLDTFLGAAHRSHIARLVEGLLLMKDSDTQHVVAVGLLTAAHLARKLRWNTAWRLSTLAAPKGARPVETLVLTTVTTDLTGGSLRQEVSMRSLTDATAMELAQLQGCATCTQVVGEGVS